MWRLRKKLCGTEAEVMEIKEGVVVVKENVLAVE